MSATPQKFILGYVRNYSKLSRRNNEYLWKNMRDKREDKQNTSS